METKIFPEQDYEIIGLEDHIACIYEKDEVYWWKNCSDIVTDVERGIYKRVDIDFDSVRAIDLKIEFNNVTEKTLDYITQFAFNKESIKCLHIVNWGKDTNFFNDSYWTLFDYLEQFDGEGDIKLDLVNKPKKDYDSIVELSRDINATLENIQRINKTRFCQTNYFYYIDFNHAVYIPMSKYLQEYNITDYNNWKIYDSRLHPTILNGFDVGAFNGIQ